MISSGKPSRQPVRTPWTRERLERERAIALGQSIDSSTWNNYSSALNSYLEFIKIHNLPVDPTPDTLSFFTVFMSFHIKPDSVDTYLSGICQQLEPYFPDIRKNRKSPLVQRTLEGCKRIRAIPTSRKRALTMDNLCYVIAHYADSTDHDDLLFVAQLLVSFFALHQENTSRVAGLARLICLTGVVSEILPSHFFIRNFKVPEVSQIFISAIYFQN